jgi:probable addiction module antidote protein
MSELIARYEDTLKIVLADPAEAAAYLNAALSDGDQEVFLLALRDVAEARGMARVARAAHLNRESMYKMLSSSGNPQLASLSALLRSFGLRLSIEVEEMVGSRKAGAAPAGAEDADRYKAADPEA